MVTLCLLYGKAMVTLWILYGKAMVTLWIPYGKGYRGLSVHGSGGDCEINSTVNVLSRL
jgi:hypothetical protein